MRNIEAFKQISRSSLVLSKQGVCELLHLRSLSQLGSLSLSTNPQAQFLFLMTFSAFLRLRFFPLQQAFFGAQHTFSFWFCLHSSCFVLGSVFVLFCFYSLPLFFINSFLVNYFVTNLQSFIKYIISQPQKAEISFWEIYPTLNYITN